MIPMEKHRKKKRILDSNLVNLNVDIQKEAIENKGSS